ncbi:MAG: hypothetical protein VB143_03175, partial [Burkholderia sp.]
HLLEAKNRESTQEPELLTGVLDWLLGVNVNRSLARPIYATTPCRHRSLKTIRKPIGGEGRACSE